MTFQDYNNLLKRRLDLTAITSTKKGKEYGTDADRLHNFKRIAELVRVDVRLVAMILQAKHIIDVVDTIHEGTPVTQAWLDEKLGDPHVYQPLLEALFHDCGKVIVPIEDHQQGA